MHLALFSQNLINTNKIEVGDNKFKRKNVSTAVRLAAKFFNKMQEHVDDNSIPKDVPAFAKSFFIKAPGGGFAPKPKTDNAKKPGTTQPADGNGGGKCKANGKEQQVQKKPKKEFSDRSLKMGLFHVKKGTPALKALPIRALLRTELASAWTSAAMRRSVMLTICYARMANIIPTGRMRPTRTNRPCSIT
jgi:hypothetical protein